MAAPRGRRTRFDFSATELDKVSRLGSGSTLLACVVALAGRLRGHESGDARLRNAVANKWEQLEVSRGLDLSLETGGVLGRQQLLIEAQEDPAQAVRLLEAHLQAAPEPDGHCTGGIVVPRRCRLTTIRADRGDVVVPRRGRSRCASGLGNPAGSRPDLAVEIRDPGGRAADPAG